MGMNMDANVAKGNGEPPKETPFACKVAFIVGAFVWLVCAGLILAMPTKGPRKDDPYHIATHMMFIKEILMGPLLMCKPDWFSPELQNLRGRALCYFLLLWTGCFYFLLILGIVQVCQ